MTIQPSSNFRVALVDPWLEGSHRAFALGLAASLDAPCEIVSLPKGSWRSRMRLGAVPLAVALDALEAPPDVILATDYVNLPALISFSDVAARIPVVLYFHENQLAYPRRDGTSGDPELGAVNVLSCLAATRCVFSSQSQREEFLEALLARFSPSDGIDPAALAAAVEETSVVLPCGIDVGPFDRARERRPSRQGKPLRLAWPHRFDHDKNPADFFESLEALAKEGLDFEVAALGEVGMELPTSMSRAKETLGSRIVAFGHLEGDAYAEALAACDAVVSTAYQETFGISVVEAIRAGCAPLLPKRLSYPELLGDASEGRLFDDRGDLLRKLRRMMREPDSVRASAKELWRKMDRFSWEFVGPKFRALLAQTAAGEP